MPVEIKELVIRAVIAAQEEENEEQSEINGSAVDQESIVQECVKQVMNILRKKEER